MPAAMESMAIVTVIAIAVGLPARQAAEVY
jgi:hypothetical protein